MYLLRCADQHHDGRSCAVGRRADAAFASAAGEGVFVLCSFLTYLHDTDGILVSALTMLLQTDECRRIRSEPTATGFDLRCAGHDTWVVRACGLGANEPPLELIFTGPASYEEALQFYLHCRTRSGA
jgi:hypothetical protein